MTNSKYTDLSGFGSMKPINDSDSTEESGFQPTNPARVRDLDDLISMTQHEILQADLTAEASLKHYYKAGEYLEALKAECKHGNWETTLGKIGISDDKALRYRSLYKGWHLLPEDQLLGDN